MTGTNPKNMNNLFKVALDTLMFTGKDLARVFLVRNRNNCSVKLSTLNVGEQIKPFGMGPGFQICPEDFDLIMSELFAGESDDEEALWASDKTRVTKGMYAQEERGCYFAVVTSPVRGAVQAEIAIARLKEPVDGMAGLFKNLVVCDEHGINELTSFGAETSQDLNLAKKIASGIRLAHSKGHTSKEEVPEKEVVGCRFRMSDSEAWEAIWDTDENRLDKFREMAKGGEFELLYGEV